MKPKDKLYVIEYVDGDLSRIGIVHDKRRDIYVIEWIDIFDMLYFETAKEIPSMRDDDIISEQLEELHKNELESAKFYLHWASVLKEFENYKKSRGFMPNVIIMK